MDKYQMAIEIMAENDELCDFVGEIDDDIIKKAENTLGTIFPKSYRAFISAFEILLILVFLMLSGLHLRKEKKAIYQKN